ncbi:MAG: 50S ribosomal protein L20, partial [Anaerolineales bacterium]|nr:50S ribosomal protein L20 [Anaerolineales bacterium]
ARLNGVSYSQLMNGMRKANIEINRKMLSDIAVRDAAAFKAVVAQAKLS